MTFFDLAETVTDITVTLSHQAQQVVVTGSRADYLAGTPTAVDALRIAWSRAAARDHADPGSMSLSLLTRSAEHPVIAWDAAVLVEADILGARHIIGRGWISNVSRHREDLWWRWDLDVVDVLGRAAGHIVRAEPWPLEYSYARLSRLTNLSGIPISRPGDSIPHSVRLAPRDSDSKNLLDLVRLCCPVGYVVGEDAQGLAIGTNLSLEFDIYAQQAHPSHGIISIPAGSVEDSGVDIHRGASVIQGTVRYRYGSPAEDGTIYRRTDDPREGARLTFETDYIHGVLSKPDQMPLGRAASYLNCLIAATATPRPRLKPARIAAGPWISEILPLNSRNPAPMIRLTDLPAWHGLDNHHHITGGTLTYAAGHLKLVISLQPAPLEGWYRATWALGGIWRTYDEQYLPGVRQTIGDYTAFRRIIASNEQPPV